MVDAAKVKVDAFGSHHFAAQVRWIAPYVLDIEKQAPTVEVEMEFTDLQEGQNLLGGISLLVGGVGILTIMSITVNERTGEIGLLRAMGVERNQILVLSLGEAVLLAVIGGLAGLVLGVGGSLLFSLVAGHARSHLLDLCRLRRAISCLRRPDGRGTACQPGRPTASG